MTLLLRGCASDALAASVALTLCEKAFSDNSPAWRCLTLQVLEIGVRNGGCRDEEARYSRLDCRLGAHRRANHRVGCAGQRERAERLGVGGGDRATFARGARVRQAGHR